MDHKISILHVILVSKSSPPPLCPRWAWNFGCTRDSTVLLCWNFITVYSMEARNRVGIGFSYRPAGLHRLAELILWNLFLGCLKVLKYRLWKRLKLLPCLDHGVQILHRLLLLPRGMAVRRQSGGGGASFCLKGTQAWEFLWIRWILYFCA